MLGILFRSSVAFFAVLVYFMPCEAATIYCPPFPHNKIIFVNNCNTPGPGTGTYDDPYIDLQVALAASTFCDQIFVFPNIPGLPYDAASQGVTTDGFTLKTSQRLLSTTDQLFQLCPNCPKPELINSSPVSQAVVTMSNQGVSQLSGFTITVSSPVQGGVVTQEFVPSIKSGAFISNCDFILTNGGTGVSATTNRCPFLIYVDGCNFYGNDNMDNTGFAFGNSFSDFISNFIITNSVFAGSASLTGIFLGSSAGPLSILIQNNKFTTSGVNQSSIYFDIGDASPINASILNNTINLTPNPGLLAGIFVRQLSSSPICLTLQDNIVTTPTNIPGYLLFNEAKDGYFFLNDSINAGSFEFLPPFEVSNLSPITYTSYLCPAQNSISQILSQLPLP